MFMTSQYTRPLAIETSKYQLLRKRLLDAYPDTDADAITDTLEGITDLHEMIAAVIRSALVDEALVGGLKRRLDEMRERQSRLETRAAKKRQLALEAMTDAGLSKLEQPDFTASTRAGTPSLVVLSEDAIPRAYWTPQPPKLDRSGVLAELKRGADIPGASLSNPKVTLAVRTK